MHSINSGNCRLITLHKIVFKRNVTVIAVRRCSTSIEDSKQNLSNKPRLKVRLVDGNEIKNRDRQHMVVILYSVIFIIILLNI